MRRNSGPVGFVLNGEDHRREVCGNVRYDCELQEAPRRDLPIHSLKAESSRRGSNGLLLS